MKKGIAIGLFLMSTFVLQAQVKVVNWKQFLKIKNETTEKVKVINFWATWCGPCIKELPVFEGVNAAHSDSVEVVLVSLDHVDRLDEKVNPFVLKKQIRSTVVLLNDIDFNTWMPKIRADWGGEIPVTLVVYKGKELFHKGEITEAELVSLIKKVKE